MKKAMLLILAAIFLLGICAEATKLARAKYSFAGTVPDMTAKLKTFERWPSNIPKETPRLGTFRFTVPAGTVVDIVQASRGIWRGPLREDTDFIASQTREDEQYRYYRLWEVIMYCSNVCTTEFRIKKQKPTPPVVEKLAEQPRRSAGGYLASGRSRRLVPVSKAPVPKSYRYGYKIESEKDIVAVAAEFFNTEGPKCPPQIVTCQDLGQRPPNRPQ